MEAAFFRLADEEVDDDDEDEDEDEEESVRSLVGALRFIFRCFPGEDLTGHAGLALFLSDELEELDSDEDEVVGSLVLASEDTEGDRLRFVVVAAVD